MKKKINDGSVINKYMNIRESHNSIIYVENRNKIMKYNIFSKNKRLLYSAKYEIDCYYMTKIHTIIICIDPNEGYCYLYWNNEMNRLEYIPINNFFWVGDSLHIHMYNYPTSAIYTEHGIVEKRNTQNDYFESASDNGKKILLVSNKHLYVKKNLSLIDDINNVNNHDMLFKFRVYSVCC